MVHVAALYAAVLTKELNMIYISLLAKIVHMQYAVIFNFFPYKNMKHSTKFWLQFTVLVSAAIIASFAMGYLVGQPTHDLPTISQF